MATRNDNPVPFMAVHPGTMVKPELKERKISQKAFAKMIGMQASHLSEFLNGKCSLTTDMAIKIESAIGIPAKVLLGAQAQYDYDVKAIRRRGIEEQKAVNELEDYNKVIDIHTVAKVWGLIALTSSNLLKEIKTRCRSASAAEMQVAFANGYFRRSDNKDVDMRMVNTWVVLARYAARTVKVNGKYSSDKITELANKLNGIFTENNNTIERVAATCGEYGIKFVQLKTKIPHTKIDGYSYMENNTPCIVISNRYDRIDSLAFNVLHELGHIKSNPASSHLNIENYSRANLEERQADDFANGILIPAKVWARSPKVKMNAREIQRKFTSWATSEGLNKWIALGRVGYETGIYAFTDPKKTRKIR